MSALKMRTLPAAIAVEIRQQILDGTHAAGAQLRQDALAQTYGVSRIPVREALIQLEAEGLVEIVPHKGAVVTPLSGVEIRDVFDLRLMLEPRLLAASIPLLDEADFAGLDTIQAAFGGAIARQDDARWGELNAKLHMAMYARAALPRSLTIVAGLLQTSERYTRLQLASPAAWQRAEAEHAELIACCKARDGERGCAVLRAHIAQVQDDLIRLIEARG